MPKVKKELVNEAIRFPKVLVIDENGEKVGVMSNWDALNLAEEKKLDLYCIAPQAKPPVCKIMSFSKYKYEKKKIAKENKKKQARPDLVKELKITALTSDNDIKTKVNQAIKLLNKGWRLKLCVYLKGRMITKLDVAQEALQKMVDSLVDYGVVDKQPTKEGRLYFCYMSPLKKKK
ncbi:MAG: translation initiation factor IF-3 [Bacilli bacterium]